MARHRKTQGYDPKTYIPMKVDKHLVDDVNNVSTTEVTTNIVTAAQVGSREITFSSMTGLMTVSPIEAGGGGDHKWAMIHKRVGVTYPAIAIGTPYPSPKDVLWWGMGNFTDNDFASVQYEVNVKTQRVLEVGDLIDLIYIGSVASAARFVVATSVFLKHR